ncbi:MAG: hypothetical protein BECKG1743E_GA0114224_105083, partial [Candidatus Kentron sp. G]
MSILEEELHTASPIHYSISAEAISIKEYTNLLVFIVQLLRCNNS